MAVSFDIDKNMDNKIVDTAFTVSGWGMRIKSITTLLTGLILFGLGIYALFSPMKGIGIIFVIIGLIVVLSGIYYWYRAKKAFDHKLTPF